MSSEYKKKIKSKTNRLKKGNINIDAKALYACFNKLVSTLEKI